MTTKPASRKALEQLEAKHRAHVLVVGVEMGLLVLLVSQLGDRVKQLEARSSVPTWRIERAEAAVAHLLYPDRYPHPDRVPPQFGAFDPKETAP